MTGNDLEERERRTCIVGEEYEGEDLEEGGGQEGGESDSLKGRRSGTGGRLARSIPREATRLISCQIKNHYLQGFSWHFHVSVHK